MRAHRAFRQLAMLLSKAGFPVLRFDYFATGDSGGAGEEGDVARWVTDVGMAIDELKDMASVPKVSLVGLRVGAALAASAAVRRSDLDQVLLWDPVISGERFVEQVMARHGVGSSNGASGTIGVDGFPLTDTMRRGLGGIDLLETSAPNARELVVVVSDERKDYMELRDRLAQRRVKARYTHIPSAGNWDEIDKFGSALLPQQIIQGIVSCLAGEGVS
jgi:pimeloyl-ACP methyl ester carboxylesterase